MLLYIVCHVPVVFTKDAVKSIDCMNHRWLSSLNLLPTKLFINHIETKMTETKLPNFFDKRSYFVVEAIDMTINCMIIFIHQLSTSESIRASYYSKWCMLNFVWSPFQPQKWADQSNLYFKCIPSDYAASESITYQQHLFFQ